MKSIQRRLSLELISVLLIVGLVVIQSGQWLLDRELRKYLQSELKDEAQGLLAALERGPLGIQLDEQRLDPSFHRQFSGHYFRIDFSDATWRSRSLWDRDLPMPPRAGKQTALGDGPQGQLLLVYRADYRRYGQNLTIVVAQDYVPMLKVFRRMRWIVFILGSGALLLILLAQRYTVRNALFPLEQARRQIAQLQQGKRSELDTQVPVELDALVKQINHLLAHTEQILKRSRNALGNLGHALKTPLAVLLSLASREELKAHPALRDNLLDQLDQIQHRLARELSKARLAGEALPGSRFNCAEELPTLFSMLTVIHNRGLQMDWQAADGLVLPWEREDLLELLGNVLDNACKWAKSRVRLQIEQQTAAYQLSIDDDGPGIDEARRRDVLNRGTRLDEQVTGHGLGLGIVCDIVEAWEGRLILEDSPLGGLRIRIVLPMP